MALPIGSMQFSLSVNGDSAIAHKTVANGGVENELNRPTIAVNPANEGRTGDDEECKLLVELAERVQSMN